MFRKTSDQLKPGNASIQIEIFRLFDFLKVDTLKNILANKRSEQLCLFAKQLTVQLFSVPAGSVLGRVANRLVRAEKHVSSSDTSS